MHKLAFLACTGAVLLAACSGNMTGATPPVAAPASNGAVQPQSVTSSQPGSAVPTPDSLTSESTVSITAATLVTLPTVGGFGGTLRLSPLAGAGMTTPLPSSSPVPSPSAHASARAAAIPSAGPTASATPGTVLITPRPKGYLATTVHIQLEAYPSAAPLREDSADDGATNPLLKIKLSSGIPLVLNGLNAFNLTLPSLQVAPDHHYAFALFDFDHTTGHAAGSLLHHKSVPQQAVAMAVTAQLSGTSLQFLDNATALTLTPKHHYVAVLYSDTVVPTPSPSPLIQPSPLPSASAIIPTPKPSATPLP